MTLKDDNATLKCVMFSAYASGLKFTPENGMKVIALGRDAGVTVFGNPAKKIDI